MSSDTAYLYYKRYFNNVKPFLSDFSLLFFSFPLKNRVTLANTGFSPKKKFKKRFENFTEKTEKLPPTHFSLPKQPSENISMDKNFSNSRAKIKAFPCEKTMNTIHRNQSPFFINKRPKNARGKETCFREKKDPPAPFLRKSAATKCSQKKAHTKKEPSMCSIPYAFHDFIRFYSSAKRRNNAS